MTIRLQKFLSACGIASRRASEELIAKKLVTINGQIARIGDKVDPEKDEVKVKGKSLKSGRPKVYIILNKPVGYITSCSSEQGPSVFDLVRVKEKLFPVGRLDKDSEGLVLLTNDGEFANRLTHPRYGCEKEYLVDSDAPISSDELDRLGRGIKLEEGMTGRCKITRIGPKSLLMVLKEGKKRQIRRMLETMGKKVVRLKRTRIKGFKLGELKPGEWRAVDVTEK